MAKVVCVLYDDPVDGYPKSYPRDDLPKIDRCKNTIPTFRYLTSPAGLIFFDCFQTLGAELGGIARG